MTLKVERMERHDMPEILLKLALGTNQEINQSINRKVGKPNNFKSFVTSKPKGITYLTFKYFYYERYLMKVILEMRHAH